MLFLCVLCFVFLFLLLLLFGFVILVDSSSR